MTPQSPAKIKRYFDIFNGDFKSTKKLEEVQTKFKANLTKAGNLMKIPTPLAVASQNVSKVVPKILPKREIIKKENIEPSPNVVILKVEKIDPRYQDVAGPSRQPPKKKAKIPTC